VLSAEKRFDLRGSHQLLQELPHHPVIEEPLPVLGEWGWDAGSGSSGLSPTNQRNSRL
jgi:hypothetical protein